MNEPFFSVIIPSHNGADHIQKALDSCSEQSFRDFETIVVCDDCNDGTDIIAKKYTSIVISVNCKRDGLARNAGLDIAKGKWILFLDDDDWWLHEFVFQQMYDMLFNTDNDLLCYGVIWKHVGLRYAKPGHTLPMCAGHVWRREFIGDTRYDDAQYSSDTHFIKELSLKKPVGMWTSMPMYYYNYMREGSLSDLHKKGVI